MESNFNNRDFEQFVKQNADQYRMFPSEKVWKGIHNTLHTRKRWYGFGLALLLLTSGAVTWVMLTPSGKVQQVNIQPGILPQMNTEVVQPAASEYGPRTTTAQTAKRNIPFTILANEQETDLLSTELAVSNVMMVIPVEPVTELPRETVIAAPRIILQDKTTVTYPTINLDVSSFVKTNNSGTEGINLQKTLPAAEKNSTSYIDLYPLSFENISDPYKIAAWKKKISWEIFFAPTVSYRKLKENKEFLMTAQALNSPYGFSSLYDINSVVTHKPDMGLELGFAAGYPLSRSLKLTAGLQVNVSKYDIKAFTHPSEVAIISLDAGNGNNSISTLTNYRNFSGNKASWLHNLYVSASLPVGAQLKLMGNKRTSLNIGGTVQPTYILNDRAYLISTDYKNYAEIPWLVRRWNLSTSFEAFAGYTTGKVKWKIGPQVRYQWLSSFQEKYPVKEHLFDYGLKVGVMLNQ